MQTTLTRTIQLDCTRADGDAVPAVLSTEFPVDRGDYIEILEHTPQSVDLSRAPLPLIESHDSSRVNVGLVTDLTVAGGKLRGMVRFGKSARARELLADVKAGIVRNLSIGYQIKAWREEGRKLIATSFQVLEASVVGVPADPAAGFYRSFSGAPNMTDTAMTERDRVREILAIGRLHNCIDDAERAISEGQPLEQFRSAVLKNLSAARRPFSIVPELSRREQNRYSVLRAVRALADPRNHMKDAGFEAEVSRTLAQVSGREARGFMVPLDLLAKRDLTTSIASGTAKSGYTVGTDLLASEFIDVLRNASVCAAAGARVMPGLVGNVTIPRRTAAVTTEWVAEGSAASEGSNTFDQVTLTPKTCTAWLDVTRRLMLQSTPAADDLVRDDLMQSILGAVDAAALGGAITNGPTGLRGTSGIGSVALGTNGGAPTWAMVVGLMREVAVDNALTGSLAFVTNEKVRAKLAQTPKQASGVEGNFILNDPNQLFGYRFLTTNAVSSTLTKGSSTSVCSAMYFGSWSDLLIGLWSGVDLIVDPYSQSTTGTVRLVAFQDADIAVRHPESFAACLDILANS